MDSVFVWTFSDLCGLIFIGLMLLVFIIGMAAHFIGAILSKIRKEKK